MSPTDSYKLNFLSSFDSLFNSPTHSDLTVKSGAASFHVHLAIISLRTPFFKDAIAGGFKESEDAVITIEEHSTHSVWRFLKWCYSGDYPSTSNSLGLGEDDDLGALRHCSVYFLADMLCVEDLKALAAQNFEAQLSDQWVLADFPGLVKEVYGNTAGSDTKLRDVLLQAAVKNHAQLKAVGAYQTVLKQYGEFSGGLVLAEGIVKAATPPKRECPNCARTDGQLMFHCTQQCGGTYNIAN